MADFALPVSTRDKIISLIEDQRLFFQSSKTLSYEFRRSQLERLQLTIQKHEKDIFQAINLDFKKSEFETYVTEIGVLYWEIKHSLKHLKKWMRPKRVSTPILHWPARSYVNNEPFGNVLVIGPWNYPFQLVIAPLIGAIAAGNTVILKPSELAPHTSSLLAKMIKETFPPDYVALVEGGIEETTALLDQQFDYIFYTGSTRVGKIIMQKAAHYLTPVTLELGGKSPCLVYGSVDMQVVARRLAWGKFMNAGQTCVAPDYVLIEPGLKASFIQALKATISDFYGANPQQSPDYPRIINDSHFKRLSQLIENKQIILGGECAPEQKYIAPTVVSATDQSPIMQDEIFGPILPVIELDTFEQAIHFVRNRPKPLAAYLFSSNPAYQTSFEQRVSAGGMCINDTVVHLSVSDLPFGGVGESGMGAYHGKYSFDTFSHKKSILRRWFIFDIIMKYPPYSRYFKLVKKLMEFFA